MKNRVELSTFMNEKRVAKTFLVNNHYYEVEFMENDQVIRTDVMKTENGDEVTFHNEVYAENAAENWVLGVKP